MPPDPAAVLRDADRAREQHRQSEEQKQRLGEQAAAPGARYYTARDAVRYWTYQPALDAAGNTKEFAKRIVAFANAAADLNYLRFIEQWAGESGQTQHPDLKIGLALFLCRNEKLIAKRLAKDHADNTWSFTLKNTLGWHIAERIETKLREEREEQAAQAARTRRRVRGGGARVSKQDARDKWIYNQCCNKDKTFKAITQALQGIAKQKGWRHISSIQGVRAAASRYAEDHHLSPIPRRQDL
jgi:hypothetical protein